MGLLFMYSEFFSFIYSIKMKKQKMKSMKEKIRWFTLFLRIFEICNNTISVLIPFLVSVILVYISGIEGWSKIVIMWSGFFASLHRALSRFAKKEK